MEITFDNLASSENDNRPPVFLYIPISRLIILSILSCGLFEIYWIYKNWSYLKLRDKLNIRPFWRGWFGIFHCRSLLQRMHTDRELICAGIPNFSPGKLSILWVALVIIANIISRAPDDMGLIVSMIIPSYLCFVPVQIHVNKINEEINPNAHYSKWSKGHIICLIVGLLFWTLTLIPIEA